MLLILLLYLYSRIREKAPTALVHCVMSSGILSPNLGLDYKSILGSNIRTADIKTNKKQVAF